MKPALILISNFSKAGRGTRQVSELLARVPSFKIVRFDAMDERGMRGPLITVAALLSLGWLMLRRPRAMVLADTAQGLRLIKLISVVFPRRFYISRYGDIYHPAQAGGHSREALKRRLFDAALKRAEHVVVPSEAAKASLVVAGVKDGADITVIANGRDFPPSEPVAFAAHEPVRLRFVGRLDARKSPYIAIETLAILRTQYSLEARLDIFGEGPDQAEAERRAVELGVDQAVAFHGLVADPWRDLARNTIALHPAIYEGFGYAVLEAIAHGVPCLAFKGCGGPEEIISATGGGLVVEERSAEALAAGVADLIRDASGLQSRMATAQRALRMHFSAQAMVEGYDRLLRQLQPKASRACWAGTAFPYARSMGETALPARPDRTMRIAILLPDLRGGGAERVSLDLAQEFARRGYKVEFVLLRAIGELLDEARSQFEVTDLGAPRLRHALPALRRYLRSRRPDALLAAMWPLTGIAALAKATAGYPCRLVAGEHNTLSLTPAYKGWSRRVHRWFGAWFYRQADAVVCVSGGVMEDLHASTRLPREHMHVIHNPVRRPSPEMAPPDPEIARWWSAGEKRLIAIGSLKTQKDYPTLIRALARLRRDRDVRLLILGEGELRADLQRLIGELGHEEGVRLAGFVQDPYPYLLMADLFVLSSAWEGLGNVITEALVAGVPVVSTDCPSGPSEILAGGRYGRLTPVGDAEALAAAIDQMLDTPVDREALRARGGEFSAEKAADQYLALLDPSGARA